MGLASSSGEFSFCSGFSLGAAVWLTGIKEVQGACFQRQHRNSALSLCMLNGAQIRTPPPPKPPFPRSTHGRLQSGMGVQHALSERAGLRSADAFPLAPSPRDSKRHGSTPIGEFGGGASGVARGAGRSSLRRVFGRGGRVLRQVWTSRTMGRRQIF